MGRIKKFFTSKLFTITLLILIQLLFIGLGIFIVKSYSFHLYITLYILSIGLAIYVANREDNPTYKMTWVMFILILPIFGALMYLILGAKKVPKSLRVRDGDLQKEISKFTESNKEIEEKIITQDPNAYKQMAYIWNSSKFPAYNQTKTEYYKVGEEYFEALKKELKKAEKFIFMEYFILEEGKMWNEILDILVDKVKQGIDVRLIYDDFGCCTKVKNGYDKYLKKLGIKVKVFNPLKPRLVVQMNNRDHRKIAVIDGKVAFTGGINLADEYINEVTYYGHWKDTGIKLEGKGVWSFTLMFLQFWDYDEKIKDDYHKYYCDEKFNFDGNGIVQPFSDTPTDNENVGENSHINMINNANKYVYITTPYLVIDQEMKNSLILAAKNGIDVRIVVPHIPDKWYVFQLTRHTYKQLLKNGVKIYEYTPGFIHAKNMISDDRFGIIGTINMDYRSYYLHYECGVWLYENDAILDMKKDYLDILEKSKEIKYEDCANDKWYIKILRAILNILAPLM